MKKVGVSLLHFVVAVTTSGVASAADIRRADGFAEGQRLAAEAGVPHLVFVHGSPWQPLSTRLLEEAWEAPRLAEEIAFPAVFTAIAIPEDPDEEEREAFDKRHEGWEARTYSTLPALQIHASDGHLLLIRQGAALRNMAGVPEWGAFLNDALTDAARRRDFRAVLDEMEERDESGEEGKPCVVEVLDGLLGLPITADADALERIALHDPEDSLGWQARLEFKPWDGHLREITAKIGDGKAAEVVEEMDRRLAAGSATPPQQALLLGGKGMALASMDQLATAWKCFEEALAAAPDDPLARALNRHGQRVAGLPLREVFPANSLLRDREVGQNLTRDHATFTLSSASADDKPEHHPSLFRGLHSPSGFAFHTAAEKDAHIIIDLAGDCLLQAVRIVNRNNLHERAATLKLWISADGESWQDVWQADGAAPAWDIPFEEPIRASYLKVGLDSSSPVPFHLLAVDAYGGRD